VRDCESVRTRNNENLVPVYHREIDGLRGLSVLLIIPFHLQVTHFYGGFVGLEVFFVISGFLITNIILGDMDAGRFSLRHFYLRRIARLVPALTVTIGLTLAASLWLFTPKGLVHAAQQSLAALFSVSNLFFWTEVDYWLPSAKGYVLLHTWSLGVEEQFYLVYPLLLWLCHRYLPRWGLLLVMLAMFIGSALANQLALSVDRTAAYYLSPLRFYEFALGGLGSLWYLKRGPGLLPGRLGNGLASSAGLALILYSAFTFHPLLAYPGYYALVPATGALLIMLAGGTPVDALLLGNRPMVWVGKLSYSLYLVHWPLIVFYRYYFGPDLSAVDCALLIAGSFALALALNRLVELPLRLKGDGRYSRSGLPASTVLWCTAGGVLLVAVVAGASIAGKGWPQRLPEHVRQIAQLDQRQTTLEQARLMEEQCKPAGKVFCGARREGALNIMLLGDSRARDIYLALREGYPDANIYASYALGCVPVFDQNVGSSHYANCPRLNRQRLQAALDAPPGEIVLLAINLTNWNGRFALETARRLVESGKQVYVLGEFMFLQGKTPQNIAIDQARLAADGDYLERFLVPAPFALDEKFAGPFEEAGATYVSNRDFFLRDGKYRVYTADDRQLLSVDGKHLTTAGAREFGEYLARHYPLEPTP
jgi:peptidoglycan/LPS O-acetylase OafA/YrhL